VNGHNAWLTFRNLEELADDLIRGSGAIDEEEVGVVDSVPDESLSVVLLLVESDDASNSEVLEYLNVVFRRVAPPFIAVDVV
jgi:hypothetical protein